jgi:N-acetylmuramate 1-kinase
MPFFSSITPTLHMTFPPERLVHLKHWLHQLPASLGLDVDQIEVASSDASFRRYLRVPASDSTRNAQSFIAMDAPPSHEDCKPFVSIAQAMYACGINVPEIIAQDLQQGFLLLTDFGNTTFFDTVAGKAPESAKKHYMQAVRALVGLQKNFSAQALPTYNREVLLRELMLYPDWYAAKHKRMVLSDVDLATMRAGFELILENNLGQPKVAVHRDYHSRNLMAAQSNAQVEHPLGIIDFQDALDGPITYDLVSLLRDAYIEWPEADVMDWAIEYWTLARLEGLPVSEQFGEFYKDFEWMGLQRHIKVLGIFARLAIRDGKEKYIDDMPLVLKYVIATANRYHVLKPLGRLMLKIEGIAPQVGYTF